VSVIHLLSVDVSVILWTDKRSFLFLVNFFVILLVFKI